MTDKDLSDKVEKIAAAMRAAMRRDSPYYSDGAFLEDMSGYIRDLENLLPNPPLPTLADMSPEERAACQWMQADVTSRSGHYVVATPHDDGDDAAALIDPDGEVDWVALEYVTPRPDLPRLEWSDKKPDPAPALPDGWRFAEHEKHGLIIVTNTTPNRLGNVYFVAPTADYIMGYDCHSCDPEELTYLPQ